MAAAYLFQSGQELVARDADAVGQGQQEVLDGQVLVAHVAADGVGVVEDTAGVARHRGLGAAVGLGQGTEALVDRAGQFRRLHPGPTEQGHGQAVGLGHQGGQQVVGGDLGVVLAAAPAPRRRRRPPAS